MIQHCNVTLILLISEFLDTRAHSGRLIKIKDSDKYNRGLDFMDNSRPEFKTRISEFKETRIPGGLC